ncbi:hypothetical protein FD755_010481 [Muntiacus reevesi]|uniref:Uncharacterized protein n=1 Tax=Muntiacus reevesi TaxID=9886 RepID=A0A5N3XYP1_MUNRE|nr:hypothetical protein FD755_010481 [Muntiacus reevesi]
MIIQRENHIYQNYSQQEFMSDSLKPHRLLSYLSILAILWNSAFKWAAKNIINLISLSCDARTCGMSSATPTSSASKTGTKTSDAAMTPKLGRVLPGTGEQPSGIQVQNLRGQSCDQPACYPRP